VLCVAFCAGCPYLVDYWLPPESAAGAELVTPPSKPEDELADDRLAAKAAAPFDPALVDPRPWGDSLLNLSAAVIRLDVFPADQEREADLLRLHPTYTTAVAAAPQQAGRDVLPSVNLLDGKAKQFDDGLYAALDLAYYQGLQDRLHSHVRLVERVYQRAGPASPAAPFLAAALQLAGVAVEVEDAGTKAELLRQFAANEVASKPIGFYTWNERLAACFRFLRFLQVPLEAKARVAQALAGAVTVDPSLRADYDRAVAFYAKLTNPPAIPAILSGTGGLPSGGVVAFFPSSTSREVELFNRLFPTGLPPAANLMHELIRRVRSGAVDLKPRSNSGWYDHQVYALETLLVPDKGEERDKLLLTRAYKQRMLEAFQALLTKRRETHVRQLPGGCAATPTSRREGGQLRPRLRVEPCPSYYVRTARAYAFLADFLESVVGKDALQSLHGLTQHGQRSPNLYAELHFLRDLFYGLYLVSAEDMGLKPTFLAGEPVDPEGCYRVATDWLPRALRDLDLAADTRVIVPIYVDPVRGVTRAWATLGVRLAKLDAEYARPPHIKQRQGGEWQPASWLDLGTAAYLIPVDEFAEVELTGLRVLTREEFRAVCDREGNKEAIVAALTNRPGPTKK
jgi:hypothetical protein